MIIRKYVRNKALHLKNYPFAKSVEVVADKTIPVNYLYAKHDISASRKNPMNVNC